MRFTYFLQPENDPDVSEITTVRRGDSVHLPAATRERAGRQRNGHGG